MNTLDWIAYVLVFLGGINWGLIGIADTNLVEMVLGAGNITNIVYILIGLSALYMFFSKCMKK